MSIYVDIEKNLGKFQLKVKFEADNETLALLGGSGCGKSMTLKCIAGIEKPDRGRIVLDDVVLFDSEKRINLKPQKRNIGYLFQQYALFPNMTVAQNIRCGIREKGNEEAIVADIIKKMHLTGLENKRPGQISGGQAQRTALARILVGKPNLIMLDEPFSALDSFLKFQLEREVRDVIAEFGKTVILVSHDRDEVYRISDKIAVMSNGHIENFGLRKALFNEPGTPTGAMLTGCKNVAPCEIIGENKIYIPSWDIELATEGDLTGVTHVGLRMHNLHLCSEINHTTFDVIDSIENPFSFTVFLRKEGNPDAVPIGIDIDKKEWFERKADKVTVSINPQKIILLRDVKQ